jgi:hypothetical protein
MNYNPIKLQNDLRLIPTATLIQYVQGMNPEVPSYMALGVLKERKEMEAKYVAENQKAPEKSVAEDLTQAPDQSGLAMLAGNPMGNQAQQMPQGAPTMPADQGVASLDTGDMFDEQNFAGGGIVAFDDGGDVNYAGGGMVAFDNGGPVATSKFGDFFRGLGNRGALDIDKQLGALQAEKNKISYDIFSAYTPEQRATQQQRLADIDAQIAALSEQRSSAANMPKVEKPALAAPGLAGLNTSPTVDNKLTNEDIGNIYRSTTPTPTKARPTVLPTAADTDVTKPAAGPAPTPREAGIESLLEDTDGVAEKKMARYKQMVGEDPERARLEELTRKYETGAAEQERMAPWMALAKAGFSMAGGKSPFAIQNISEGAQAGLADYVQAKDKLDKLTEKQIDIRSKMQQARRAEDIAGATYGLNSEAAIEARNAQVKLKDLEEKNANKRNEVSNSTQLKAAQIAAAKKSDYETFIDLAKQDEDNYKTVKDKDGNIKKIFDAGKVTQTYKAFGSSGSTDKEFAEQYERLSMLDKDFKKQYPTAADYILDQRARLSGAGAPAASLPSAGFSNLRISK